MYEIQYRVVGKKDWVRSAFSDYLQQRNYPQSVTRAQWRAELKFAKFGAEAHGMKYRLVEKTNFIPQKAAKALLAACQEFVRKCECGEARSVRSYAQMKDAISLAKGGK